LLEDWEVGDVKKRFADQTSIARLDDPPVASYRGVAVVHLFDLLPSAKAPTEIVLETDAHDRAVPPGPPPSLTFRRPSSPDHP
jgi:hypothetical protein